MEQSLKEKDIGDQVAELQISFPVVAPRLLMNLELDRDPYYGFDSPVLKTMAKYQVPVLLDYYVRVGAFSKDESRRSGYRSMVRYRITDGTGRTKEQKAEYLKNFANVVSEKISEGHPNRMAAAVYVMTQEQHDELIAKVMPILREVRGVPPGPDTRGVRVMFCTVMEND